MTISFLVAEEVAHGAVHKDVANAVRALVRTARARPLYSANNKALVKMMDELMRALDQVFSEMDEISLKVQPDAFIFDDEPVFEETNADVSVPFLFFRDGIRRLELVNGIDREEVGALLDAAAHGMDRRGLDDDIVSILWRHQLDHVRYVTVDTTVVDAEDMFTGDLTIDDQIDAIIRTVYSSTEDDVGVRSIHLDASDLTAKGLAEALGNVDEMEPGLHPPRNFLAEPSYRERLVAELDQESELSIMELAGSAAAEAMAHDVDELDAEALCQALLSIYDAAVLEDRIGLARQLVDWVLALGERSPRVTAFLQEALSEARVRQLVTGAEANAGRQQEILAFLASCGRAAVPPLVALVPSLTDPQQRRAFTELVLRIGMEEVEPLYHLLSSEQGFVAAEALHMLAQLDRLDQKVARMAAEHAKPQVRLALLQLLEKMERGVGESVVLELIEDREPRVRTEAVTLLGKFDSPRAKGAIESMIARENFEEASAPVKQAVLLAFVQMTGRHAFDRLEELIRSTDRRLTRKPLEELGVAAVVAIATLPSTRAVTILKKACLSRNKKVRERARAELKKMRKDFE